MTAQQHRIYRNLYKDSVALMAVSAQLMKADGVQAASVVMATDSNRENLRTAGLDDVAEAGPNDLLVVVRADLEAAENALAQADDLLSEQPLDGSGSGRSAERVPTSIGSAVRRDPASNLALISVPGPYAAAEALKALRLGLHAMVFSDNVPVAEEIELKRYAAEHGLLVMGPDCGTALVNGMPLGFANVVRRGRVGVVGASGTGMQEVTCRVHQLGASISQALGTGGHDLSAEVGGSSTLQALQALADDADTDVIVLVSKPPAPEVARRVLELAREVTTPVVVAFVGAESSIESTPGLIAAGTLAGAADLAVAALSGDAVARTPHELPADLEDAVRRAADQLTGQQQYVRGIFSGGTFCAEAQLLCRRVGIEAASNTPVAGNTALSDIWTSPGHTIIDMGDDTFTRGRPHPMIDPTLRDERLLAEAGDPSTAVLLFDVVLGHGAAGDPVTHLVSVLGQCQEIATQAGRSLPVIAHVCGTDEDPQHRPSVIGALRSAGVLVADSNAQAALMAGELVRQFAGQPRIEGDTP